MSAKPTTASKCFVLLKRILTFVLVAYCIGWLLQRAAAKTANSDRPAGLVAGITQGALMPLAMPNLLVGHDVTIYAPNNTGRTYKLGYTLGVNGCGAIFFGYFFWRVNRWRKQGKAV